MVEKERAHPRVQVNIKVKVKLPQGKELMVGPIKNMSLGGVFIETLEPPGFGAEMDLEFSIPGREVRAIRCKGFVAWTSKGSGSKAGEPPGMGVRLTDIGVQEMRALAAFIDGKLGDT